MSCEKYLELGRLAVRYCECRERVASLKRELHELESECPDSAEGNRRKVYLRREIDSNASVQGCILQAMRELDRGDD